VTVEAFDGISFNTDAFKSIIQECNYVFKEHLKRVLTGWNKYGLPPTHAD
jgi:hypothetical protein